MESYFRKNLFIAVLTVFIAVLVGCNGKEPGKRNLIIIAVDTLRADYVSCIGDNAATPNIDKLAEEGVLFSRAYSNIPITGPSFSTVFTGLPPQSHGVLNNTQLLKDEYTTLAEVLKENGYTTGAFLSLPSMKSEFGLSQGFSTYNDSDLYAGKYADEVNRLVFPWLRKNSGDSFFLFVHYQDPHSPNYPKNYRDTMRITWNGEHLTDLAPEDVKQHTIDLKLRPGRNEMILQSLGRDGKPINKDSINTHAFRVFNHIANPSGIGMKYEDGWSEPYEMWSKDTRKMNVEATIIFNNPQNHEVDGSYQFTCIMDNMSLDEIRDRYRVETEYVDKHIGELVEKLKENEVYDDSLIIFMSDHGEGLGEHNCVWHVENLYESLLRVPLIFKAPGLPAGMERETEVSLVDFLPTTLELLEIEHNLEIKGVSLAPVIKGDDSENRILYAETDKPESPRNLRAVIADSKKLIWNPDTDVYEFYDLSVDPAEADNIAEADKELTEKYRQVLHSLIETQSEASEAIELDAQLVDELRSVGYLK